MDERGDKGIFYRIKRAKDDLVDLKSSQSFGAESVALYQSQPLSKSYFIQRYNFIYTTITFTANQQKNHLCELSYTCDEYLEIVKNRSPVDSTTTTFTVRIENTANSDKTIPVTFYALSTDYGVLS